jgi:hypothetical protein
MTRGYHLSLTSSQLMAQARELTGIELYDRDAEEPLAVLFES